VPEVIRAGVRGRPARLRSLANERLRRSEGLMMPPLSFAKTRPLRAMPYREYLQTSQWKSKREEKLRAAGYRCQVCNSG